MTKNVSGQVRANAAFTQKDENGQIVQSQRNRAGH